MRGLENIKMPYRQNWIFYKQFCYRNGLAEGNYKNFYKFLNQK